MHSSSSLQNTFLHIKKNYILLSKVKIKKSIPYLS